MGKEAARAKPIQMKYGQITPYCLTDFKYDPGTPTITVYLVETGGSIMELQWKDGSKPTAVDSFKLETPLMRVVKQESLGLVHQIKGFSAQVESVVLLFDGDNAGYSIADDVATCCKKAKESLTFTTIPFISCNVKKVMQKLKNPLSNDKHANCCRDAKRLQEEIDWRVVHAFTTNRKLPTYSGTKFLLLGMIVRRDRKVDVSNKIPTGLFTIGTGGNRFEIGFVEVEDVVDSSVLEQQDIKCDCTVGEVDEIKCPAPLNTVDLIGKCFRYFGFNAKYTMKCAQELYRQGFISYPRTSERCYPTDSGIKNIMTTANGYYDKGSDWKSDGKKIYQDSDCKRHAGDVKVHPAIYPLKISGPSSIKNPGTSGDLFEDLKKVYACVVENFLGSFSDDAQVNNCQFGLYHNKKRVGTISGKRIVQEKFLRICSNEKGYLQGKKGYFFTDGSLAGQLDVKVNLWHRKSLNHFNDEELLSVMEKDSIGSPASYVNAIEELTESKLISYNDAERVYTATTSGTRTYKYHEDMGFSIIMKPYWRMTLAYTVWTFAEGRQEKSSVLEKLLLEWKRCWMDVNRLTQGSEA